MLLIVYNQTICEEISLPDTVHSEYVASFDSNRFALAKSLSLCFENRTDGWYISARRGYQVFFKRENVTSHRLCEGDIIVIRSSDEELFLIVSDQKRKFVSMRKYNLTSVTRIPFGRESDNAISYDFAALLSSHHGELRYVNGAWYVVDGSANGIFVNHARIHRQRRLSFGDHIHVFGLHIVFMGNVLLVHNSCGVLSVHGLDEMHISEVKDDGEEHPHAEQYFNRSPRVFPVIYQDTVEIEGPPDMEKHKEKPAYMVIGPAFTMAIPMCLGFAMAAIATTLSGGMSGVFMYTGIITAVGSAIIGAIWAMLNMNYARKESIEEETTRFNAYSNYLMEKSETLRSRFQMNVSSMHTMYPASSALLSYTARTRELWNRNSTQSDFLCVRVGLGDQPFQAEIKIPEKRFSLVSDSLLDKPEEIRKQFSTMHQVPVCLDLFHNHQIGVAGETMVREGLLRVLVVQLAALHCYTDVKFVFLYDEKREDWSYMRWFPHVFSEDGTVRYVAGNENERREVLSRLNGLVVKQREGQDESNVHYVVFCSHPDLLQDEPVTRYQKESVKHITLVLFADHSSQLPNVISCMVSLSPRVGLITKTVGENEDFKTFVMDKVSVDETEAFARRLSSIRVKEADRVSEIPDALSFLDMYNVHSLKELDIAGRWRRSRTDESLRALLGIRTDGAPCYLDVHEKYHGPHGLVAGTTGSGKSELLETYILSLAVNFSPEDVSFFLIDFKGAGMANLFKDLPHVAGVISNLSGTQIERAMISIRSENTRRQRLFARYGVNHIDQYTKLYKNREAVEKVPHLFIIIDEFAELKKQEGGFMSQLISVAQVGRSLGVHLILATQRPNGTVDDNIRSNARFRLCLRVQDRQDSMDMIHKPDAAYLSEAGRCFLQVGNDEVFTLFQTGYSGAIYDAGNSSSYSTSLIGRDGLPLVVMHKQKGSGTQMTELEALVKEISSVAKENGYAKSPALWLEPLGKRIDWKSLPVSRQDGEDIVASIGLYDDPHHQSQLPLTINFNKTGHFAVCGMAVSGKSTLLETLVYALTQNYTAEEVHLYLIDYSSNRLSAFADSVHVGGYMNEESEERTDKFFHYINGVLDNRKKELAGGTWSEYRKNGRRLPAVVVVLDNYDGFREKTDDRYERVMMRILREGTSRGVFMAMSASGFSMHAIPLRMADNIRMVVSLEQQDRFKYMDVLRCGHLDLLPEKNTRGRGLVKVNDGVNEFQTAIVYSDMDDYGRSVAIEKKMEQMKASYTGAVAPRVPEIPENRVFDALCSDGRYRAKLGEKTLLPYAWKKDDASMYALDLRYNYAYMVYGAPRSGKTNALKVLMRAACAKKAKLVVIEKGGVHRLKKEAEQCKATYIEDDVSLFAWIRDELTPLFKERNARKNALLEEGFDDVQVAEKMGEEEMVVICIDDMHSFLQQVYTPEEGVGKMNARMENFAEKGSLHNIVFICGVNTKDISYCNGYRLFQLFSGYHTGVVIGRDERNVLHFDNVSRDLMKKAVAKGEGYASVDGKEETGTAVVIPLVGGNI